MNWPHAYENAHTLVHKLRHREISSQSLVEECIRRIEQFDVNINAVVVRDFARAREAALRADKALASGAPGALLGLPVTLKESYSVAGLSKTWGLPNFQHSVEHHDSVVAARLKREGAIILGKTNVPAYLGDWQTANELYGVTNNPWDFTLTAGGSSGGSAAALAAGYVSLEFGSDLNGSLRIPAHCCGVYAHLPSYGLVPHRGHEFPGQPWLSVSRGLDFAVNGPLARCADDLAMALQVIAGPDDDMVAGYTLSLKKSRHHALKDFRVLMLTHHPFMQSSHDVASALDACATHLRREGGKVEHTVQHIDLSTITTTFLKQVMAVLFAEAHPDDYQKAKHEASLIAESDTSIDAIIAKSQVMSYREFAQLNRIKTAIRHQWRELFTSFDVVLCPAMPMCAFPHDLAPDQNARMLVVDDHPVPYGTIGVWNALATFCGLPSTVMPIGLSKNGLPIGMQIIGPFLEDATTIAFAKCLEQSFGGFTRPTLGTRAA